MSAVCLQKFIYISVWRQSGCTVKAKVANFWWASMMNFWSSCFQCVLYILERIGKRTRSWIWSCPRFKSINRVFVSLDLAVSFIFYFSSLDLFFFIWQNWRFENYSIDVKTNKFLDYHFSGFTKKKLEIWGSVQKTQFHAKKTKIMSNHVWFFGGRLFYIACGC